jgi:hypothetical protein
MPRNKREDDSTGGPSGLHRGWQQFSRSRWGFCALSFVFLLLLSGVLLTTTGCFTVQSCFPLWYSSPSRLSDNLPAPQVAAVTAQGQFAGVWVEFMETGVYTPTTTAHGLSLQTPYGEIPPLLDELAEKGYVAIRVPHAPPTYTTSSLLPGIPPWEPNAVVFSYYAPPSATELTTVTIPITRRAEYEAVVNSRYPIEDGQSHWEVWWLPEGEEFPIPNEPFRLDGDSWPPPLGLRFRIGFVDADAHVCAGCPAEVLGYNGYVFIGPYEIALRYTDSTDYHEPLVSFGGHCGYESEALFSTFGTIMSPTVPFTHVHCLENWDSVARTFTVTSSSSQGWDYTYYSQTTDAGAMPVPVGDPPFTVQVGPPPDSSTPGCLGLLAVYTPDITLSDTMRETFRFTATSVVSPEVQASAVSFALAPGYELNELGQYHIYLPLVLRSN